MTADEDEEVLALLEDEYARAILIEASIEEREFVESYQELDPEGHHYKTYCTRLERVGELREETGTHGNRE
ncbi:hypothetical protein ACYJ1Y_16945 [Natrialbaceae archaeon A-gly3]